MPTKSQQTKLGIIHLLPLVLIGVIIVLAARYYLYLNYDLAPWASRPVPTEESQQTDIDYGGGKSKSPEATQSTQGWYLDQTDEFSIKFPSQPIEKTINEPVGDETCSYSYTLNDLELSVACRTTDYISDKGAISDFRGGAGAIWLGNYTFLLAGGSDVNPDDISTTYIYISEGIQHEFRYSKMISGREEQLKYYDLMRTITSTIEFYE